MAALTPREALFRAAEQFRFYERQHEAKNTAESTEKAMVNRTMAEMCDAASKAEAKDRGELRIVFDGPPSPSGAKFVEVEDVNGHSVNIGIWRRRPDKLWELVIPA